MGGFFGAVSTVPQPPLIRTRPGIYAITTVGCINNMKLR